MLAQLLESIFKILGVLCSVELSGAVGVDFAYAVKVAALGMIFLFFNSLSHAQVLFQGLKMGMKARIMLNCVAYKKLLGLTISSDSAAGQVVNLVSNDIQKIEDMAPFVHFILFAGVESLLMYAVIVRLTGSAWLASITIGFVTTIALLTILFAWLFARIRQKMVVVRDDLTRNISDMITGMHVIKYYAWEEPFLQRIVRIRRDVTRFLSAGGVLRGVTSAVYMCANDCISMIMLVLSYAQYALHSSQGTNPTTDYSALIAARGVFENVVLVVCYFFPKAVELLSEARVSVVRLEEFMLKRDVAHTANSFDNALAKTGYAVVLRDACFEWPYGDEKLSIGDGASSSSSVASAFVALENISLQLQPGELTIVIGNVGAGKTTLLNAILREIRMTSGEFYCVDSVAYCTQQPWLINRSLRDNILLGRPFDAKHYERVLAACELQRDIRKLPQGDATLVGERGAALSGGQKARVSLARALYYRDAELFILDDVLSAVDNIVGAAIFRNVKAMLREKCCVLVTHQLQFVSQCHTVVLMHDLKTLFVGTYADLMATSLDYVEVLQSYDRLRSATPIESVPPPPHTASAILDAAVTQAVDDVCVEGGVGGGDGVSSTVAEDVHASSTGLRSYRMFFAHGGNTALVIFLLLCAVVSQVALVLFLDYAESWSVAINDHAAAQKATALFTFELVIFPFFYIFFHLYCLRCSRAMFSAMMKKVASAPLFFFQSNPQGRILNRFSRDQALIDEVLYINMTDTIHCAVQNVIALGMIVYYNPFSLLLMPVLCVFVLYFKNKFFRVSRDIKRLEADSRSPVYSLLSCTLEGLPVIRCFGATDMFFDSFLELQNENTRSLFSYIGIARWFSFNIDMLCSAFFYNSFVVMSLLVGRRLRMPDLKMGLIYCQKLSELVTWTGKMIAELDNNMTSVDRISAYTTIECEGPYDTPEDQLLPYPWPEHGCIEFRNVTLRYPSRIQPSLHSVTCRIAPGEKIAVVGRTGAGKSSFVSSLFRIVEALPKGGIFIDGVDIRSVGLRTLRKNLSIIPQDPFLFKGDIRFNLDPFDEHSDARLWDALALVRLDTKIRKQNGLSTSVLENGSNFSAGQKQLICLARSILRQNQIIVMDEATANIDLATSQMIQKTVQALFRDKTLCTIAHRLHTIIDYDRVFVLHHGRIVESGAPHELLSQTQSSFSQMVSELGPDAEQLLKRIARETYEARHASSSSASNIATPK